jgi:MFS family permease
VTEESNERAIQQSKNRSDALPAQELEAIGFFQAFLLPNVLTYAVAFGFFKLVRTNHICYVQQRCLLVLVVHLCSEEVLILLFPVCFSDSLRCMFPLALPCLALSCLCLPWYMQVNYAMFFQLPVILSSHFDESTSNVISALYSVGMMPGGIVCGWVSDMYGGRRACVIATFMGVLCPLLLVFAYCMDTLPVVVLLLLLAFMGCLVGGPNNIITSAVAADLADDPSIKGNNRAVGTVTGIINGSGSITAAIGQLAIPVLYDWGKTNGVGYRYVWFFLVFCTFTGTSLLGGKIYRELYPNTRPTESLISMTARPAGYQAISTHDSRA